MAEQLEFTLESRSRLLTVDEIYGLYSDSWLKLIKEDRRVERKTAAIQASGLSVYFSMWANTPPHGGIIAIGITDEGEIEGILKSSVSHINDLERCGDNFAPDARYETKRVEVTNAKGKPDQILLIRVHYNTGKVVRTTKGLAWDRRGASKRQLPEEVIREIQIEKGELSWERERTSQRFPADFDLKSLRNFADSVIKNRRLEHSTSLEEVLTHRHLGTMERGKFFPNKACAMLFAKDPCKEVPGCRIRFLRFDGITEEFGERRNQIKDEWIEGNIPSQLVQADAIISSQLREFSRLGKDGKFVTSQEYPKPAWYEAIVNAVVHRSYNLQNVPIFVRMFDNRLEVESPGGFLPFVTPQNIYDRHDPRNPDLMNALYFLDYVKCANEGTKRMRATMQELQLPPPIFQETGTNQPKFSVVLKNDVEHRKAWLDSDASKVVGEALFCALTDHEKRLINYVAEFRKISVTDAVRITGKAWEGCKALLNGLCERGILKHIHRKDILRDSKAHYVLAFTPKN